MRVHGGKGARANQLAEARAARSATRAHFSAQTLWGSPHSTTHWCSEPSLILCCPGDVASLYRVPSQKRVLVAIALLAAFVLAMTMGSVWHNHAGSSDANCSICHLSHQPVDHSLVSHREPSMAQVDTQTEPEEPGSTLGLVAPRLPARAPPPANHSVRATGSRPIHSFFIL